MYISIFFIIIFDIGYITLVTVNYNQKKTQVLSLRDREKKPSTHQDNREHRHTTLSFTQHMTSPTTRFHYPSATECLCTVDVYRQTITHPQEQEQAWCTSELQCYLFGTTTLRPELLCPDETYQPCCLGLRARSTDTRTAQCRGRGVEVGGQHNSKHTTSTLQASIHKHQRRMSSNSSGVSPSRRKIRRITSAMKRKIAEDRTKL